MLTDTSIRKFLRDSSGPAKAYDGLGLFLLRSPIAGRGKWRLKYVRPSSGKESLLGLGQYPEISLKQARERRDEARKLLATDVDPSAERQAAKAARADSVAAISKEWLDKQTNLSKDTIAAHTQRLGDYIFPKLGDNPIASVEPPDLLAALRRIEHKGLIDTAHRTLSLCGRVWRYAIATGRATRDITRDLQGALPPVRVTNHAAVTDPRAVGELLRAIDGYRGQETVCFALRLAPMLFVRPGELRHAEWPEFDLDAAEPVWRIPAAKMKMRREHLVPLASQAVELLRELKEINGGRYLFPSLRTGGRPMSENTVNAALRRLGFSGDMQTGHGFRTIASTTLNELGWHPDVIELQLAHQETNKVRASYNKAQRLAERRKMMQAWADHLDTLKAGDKKVVPIRRAAGSVGADA